MKILWIGIMLFFSSLCVYAGTLIKSASQSEDIKIPIVYHKEYNISFFGLEKLHTFDSQKYGKVMAELMKHFSFSVRHCFKPSKISDEELLLVHSKEYLHSLSYSSTVAQITEMPILRSIPNFLVQWRILDPMRYATAGTVLGAELALKYGWSINLSGGYHHAKSNQGGGFCVFADIPLAIKKLRLKNNALKVLVIDLDAHQGNGHESILANDPLSYVFDIYSSPNYPSDYEAQHAIDFNYPVKIGIKDEEYLGILKNKLPEALEQVKPDFIIYNAGTDCYEKDKLGRMSLTKECIIQRDIFVFQQAQERKIPILMVLSGGYTGESAHIIASSLKLILQDKIKSNNTFKR